MDLKRAIERVMKEWAPSDEREARVEGFWWPPEEADAELFFLVFFVAAEDPDILALAHIQGKKG